MELQDPRKLAAEAEDRRKWRDARDQEARAVAHIQDTVASAVDEARRKSHPVSEAEIWKGIVEKDGRISKQYLLVKEASSKYFSLIDLMLFMRFTIIVDVCSAHTSYVNGWIYDQLGSRIEKALPSKTKIRIL